MASGGGPEQSGVDLESGHVLRSQATGAVLGLVIEKPSHGYEIGQRFEARFAGILTAGRSSIYASLTALLEAGMIEKMAGRSTTGVRRGAKAGASYRATATGARAYRGWLSERVREDPQRVEMLGRLMLLGMQSVEAALEFIDRYEHQCFVEAREIARPSSASPSTSTDVTQMLERLVVEARQRILDAELAWIASARAELRSLAASKDDDQT